MTVYCEGSCRHFSYRYSFNNQINIYLKPEAQGLGVRFKCSFYCQNIPKTLHKRQKSLFNMQGTVFAIISANLFNDLEKSLWESGKKRDQKWQKKQIITDESYSKTSWDSVSWYTDLDGTLFWKGSKNFEILCFTLLFTTYN